MLPTKLSSKDVKGWANSKLAAGKKAAGRAPTPKKKPTVAKPDPALDDEDDTDDEDPEKAALKAKVVELKEKLTDAGIDPDDDEEGNAKPGAKADKKDVKASKDKATSAKPPAAGGKAVPGQEPPDDDEDTGLDDEDAAAPKAGLPKAPLGAKAANLPNTEPKDPMNRGGIDGPDPDDVLLPEGEEALLGEPTEIEQKLGDFAEVLEHRAGELEELATEVQGDLMSDEPDMETVREAQAAIPADIRQDLVEHMSAMEPDEILEFCEHLRDAGKVDDPELLAAFLRAAATDSTEDDEEVDEDEDEEDDEGETETDSDEDV